MPNPGNRILTLLDEYLNEVNKEIDQFESELLRDELSTEDQER